MEGCNKNMEVVEKLLADLFFSLAFDKGCRCFLVSVFFLFSNLIPGIIRVNPLMN